MSDPAFAADGDPRPVDVDDGVGERCRGLLRQIVPYAACGHTMLVGAGEQCPVCGDRDAVRRRIALHW